MDWIFELLLDFYYNDALTLEQMGLRALQGRTAAAAGKGLLELAVYKKIWFGLLAGRVARNVAPQA
eukprot:7216217-Pyramimonas_sp.AAC.1